MTLENLLAIHKLQAFAPDPAGIARLLAAAERNLKDAGIAALSAENRFDAAYKAIMQCAMIGLWANGYRTSTSQPGHHQTAIQCLTLTVGAGKGTVIVLGGLRKQRNINDYLGDPITDAALATCIDEAEKLLVHTGNWLREQHPELVDVA